MHLSNRDCCRSDQHRASRTVGIATVVDCHSQSSQGGAVERIAAAAAERARPCCLRL